MDTAPTGHPLLLLDASGAYHREIARQMSGKDLHFTTPMILDSCAPCQGAVFQRVRIPPGNFRSGR